MPGALGRRPPSDWKHVDKFPLTAATTPSKPTPVVIGVNWYVEFDKPTKDAQGHSWIARDGKLTKSRGGHCVCLKPRGHTDPDVWWEFYNQGSEGACVGFGISRLASQLNRKLYDGFWLYREAQKIDEWPGECVDYKTECLSQRGWLRGDELVPGDLILTFDLDANGTRWAEVERVHRHAMGAYREWSQRGFSLAVTDDHRWVVTNRNLPGRYDLVTTRGLRSQHALPRAAPSLDTPHDPIVNDDLVELVAWVMCEGHYRPPTRRGNGIIVSQKVYRRRVADLMRRVGGPAGSERDGLGIWELSGALASTVRDIAPDRAPHPDWLTRLTQRQLRLFIETCVAADGSVTRATSTRRERATFCQLPGVQLDAFLAACALAGQPVSRARVEPIRGVETWTLRSGSGLVEARNLTPGPFVAGPVWCPETSCGDIRSATPWLGVRDRQQLRRHVGPSGPGHPEKARPLHDQ